jgi:hypothetical protein
VSLSCQLLFAERQLDALVLDLVALETVAVGGRVLETGAPMALALRFDPAFSDNVEPTVDRLERWADTTGLVEIEFLENTARGGSGLVLSKDDEEIVLSTTPGVWERE